MIDIGYAGALLGGIATLFSPCSAMLLPAFFAYAFSTRRALVGRTFIFWLGLITTLVPLGAAAGSLGLLFAAHRFEFVTVASLIIIVFGLLQALGISLPLPRFGRRTGDGTSVVAVYLLGTVYGIAGACAGPILGSVLSVAAIGQDAVRGGLLLAVFAVGMVVPLLVLALIWDAAGIAQRGWLKPRPVSFGPVRTTLFNLISGLLFVLVGVLMMTTDGLSGLAGVFGADRQQQLEIDLLGWAAGIPDPIVVVTLLLLVTVGIYGYRRLNSSRNP